MNIVAAGSRLQVYGEDVKTYKKLPIGSYDVKFNKMTGFYLTVRHDLTVTEKKIYGNHEKKINKVMRSFDNTDRNFGIILSGQKGIGKSLFARILATKATEAGYPVIIVAGYEPGIADFLSSIEQEVVVIFDEFEKTFPNKEDNFSPQEEMLSLFDGIDCGKKLFVITCNDVHKLNNFMINRPGRFHYHFVITNPSAEEVEEYLTDKLDPKYANVIEKVVNFSRTINITYDYLRAIVFELNQGYSLEETLNDLNITRTSDVRFNITITTVKGKEYHAYGQHFDLYNPQNIGMRAYSGQNSIWFSFSPTDIHVVGGKLTLNPAKVEYNLDKDDYWDEDETIWDAKYKKALEEIKFKSIIIEKNNFSVDERYTL